MRAGRRRGCTKYILSGAKERPPGLAIPPPRKQPRSWLFVATGRAGSRRVTRWPERRRLRTCKPAPGGTLSKIVARMAASEEEANRGHASGAIMAGNRAESRIAAARASAVKEVLAPGRRRSPVNGRRTQIRLSRSCLCSKRGWRKKTIKIPDVLPDSAVQTWRFTATRCTRTRSTFKCRSHRVPCGHAQS
jgi:hypothetical protein